MFSGCSISNPNRYVKQRDLDFKRDLTGVEIEGGSNFKDEFITGMFYAIQQ